MNLGDRFGKLTAVRDLHEEHFTRKTRQHIWRFVCDCGAEVDRAIENVKRSLDDGHTPACPRCRRRSPPPRTEPVRLDLSGQTFGKLTAIRPTGQVDSRRNIKWLFQCICGKTVERAGSVVVQSVTRGRVPTCGRPSCNNHRKRGFGESSKRAVISSYKRQAEKRGYCYELTDRQTEELLKSNCHYCGNEPSSRYQRRDTYGFFDYNGIDRKNNMKGYTIDNVVPCCKRCNYAKKDMSYEDFTKWLDQIVRFRSSRNG